MNPSQSRLRSITIADRRYRCIQSNSVPYIRILITEKSYPQRHAFQAARRPLYCEPQILVPLLQLHVVILRWHGGSRYYSRVATVRRWVMD
jgi:hypothetical protein